MPRVEIRCATAEELPAMGNLAATVMGLPPAMFQGMATEWTLCAFADGALATSYAAWPLTIRFNGNPVPMAGVTWVSTHPAHRRRGYLRAIVSRHFEAMHEHRRQAIAGLHPAWSAIYRRYGYGLITNRVAYTVDPRDLRFAHALAVRGSIRELDPVTEFATMVDVYRRYREERNGLVHRGRAMWDSGPLAAPGPRMSRSVFVYEEDGVALGYVTIQSGPGPDRDAAGPPLVIVVDDLFAVTPEALQAIWQLLGGYDNVRTITWGNAAPDDPLPHMLVEPRMLNARIRDGIMARLVNVDDALALRPYGTDAVLRFELDDDVCPWNSGRWELVTTRDGGEAKPTSASPDLRLAPDVLAMIAFGRISATDAARAGLAQVEDERALARWDAAMKTKHFPHESEHTW